jgi:photosystem II stability/assembly factor-like uncharacterized protein
MYLAGKIIFLILIIHLPLSSQWTKLQAPVSSHFQTLSFPDSMHAWAASDEGHIIHSSDGGYTWSLQQSPVAFSVFSIFFLNPQTGWATASGGFQTGNAVLKTTNSGVNWTYNIFPDSNTFFYTIYFLNALTGYMGGLEGRFVKTTNGGSTWFNLVTDTTSFSGVPVNKISMFSNSYGYGCGGFYDLAGVVWKTTNTGLTWQSAYVSSEPLFDIFYFDSLNVIMAGGDFELGVQMIRTTNAGSDWEYIPLNTFGIGRAVSFRTPLEGWMVLSFSPNFLVTTNGGYNWYSVPAADTSELYDISFSNTRSGLAVGKEGKILKYDPSFIGIKNINHNIPDKYILFQNYPNPFNPVTKIRFFLTHTWKGSRVVGFVNLTIYNSLGQYIKTLVDAYLTPGEYEIGWNASNLPSGLYYYSLSVNNNIIETKKMVLLK